MCVHVLASFTEHELCRVLSEKDIRLTELAHSIKVIRCLCLFGMLCGRWEMREGKMS